MPLVSLFYMPIFFGSCLYSPTFGSVNEDASCWVQLHEDLTSFQPFDPLLIVGDFNARIAGHNEISTQTSSTADSQLPSMPSRHSLDRHFNSAGGHLISLFQTFRLIVSNGRCPSDL